MSRDIEMQHASAIMAYNEKAVERAESQGRNSEEIHRGDGLPMIAQEAQPSSGRVRVPGRSAHPTGDGPLGNIETQHQELTMYSGCAPGWVFRHHPKNQITNVFRNSPPTDHPVGFGDDPPIERKTRSVPTDNGLRANDNESLFPSRPELPRQNPEDPIEHG